MSMLIAASSFGKVEAPGESASLGTKAEAADLPNRCQLTPGPLSHIINIMKIYHRAGLGDDSAEPMLKPGKH